MTNNYKQLQTEIDFIDLALSRFTELVTSVNSAHFVSELEALIFDEIDTIVEPTMTSIIEQNLYDLDTKQQTILGKRLSETETLIKNNMKNIFKHGGR